MLWKVPITVATKGNPQAASLVLSQQSTTVTLEGVEENDWVLVSMGEREGERERERIEERERSPCHPSHTLLTYNMYYI